MKTALLVLLFSLPAFGQLRPLVTVAVGSEEQLGYKTPSLLLSAGAEYQDPKSLIIGSVTWGSGKKDVNGYSLNGALEGNSKIPLLGGNLLTGGGFSCGELVTNAYRKGACRPYAQVGTQGSGMRVRVGWLWKGTDDFNNLRGLFIKTSYDYGSHFRAGLDFGKYWFNETNPPYSDRVGRTFSVGASWVF